VVKRYLTTAWMWLESGSGQGPDPYQITCMNNPTISQVSYYCNHSSAVQISGYQAQNRRNDYVRMFNLMFPGRSVSSVMGEVLANSGRASRAGWDYKHASQQKGLVARYAPYVHSATLADISPNRPLSGPYGERGQFFTYLLGKHPRMAIPLNSFAVSDGDLVRALRTQYEAYGYIGPGLKQLLANMVEALRRFEAGSSSPAPAPVAAAYPVVRRGATGVDVRTVQRLLASHGLPVAVDGVFGPDTEAAVRTFQTRQRMEADGAVGPLTWGRLVRQLVAGSRGPAVAAAQEQLTANGHAVPATGYYGSQTQAAARAFQSRQGLEADGATGPITWRYLVARSR
jgi:peptidoglycan hydrolase-like protein with peptidoglycan-binding domain